MKTETISLIRELLLKEIEDKEIARRAAEHIINGTDYEEESKQLAALNLARWVTERNRAKRALSDFDSTRWYTSPPPWAGMQTGKEHSR